MKRFGKVLVFAAYFLFAAVFCVLHYQLYRDSFTWQPPHEHPVQLPTMDEPVYLDLNKASVTALTRIPGMSRALAEEIVRYREENGGFTGFQQLLKVEGMSEQLYLSLGDYLYLSPAVPVQTTCTATEAATQPPTTEIPTETQPATIPVLDLNTATAQELALLPEIGDTLAQAIVTFRAQNGNFSNRRQLLHVSGIGEATLAKLMPYLYLVDEQPWIEPTEPPTEPPEPTDAPVQSIPEPTEIPVVNLNTATYEQLLCLPECTPELAKNVLRLREAIHVFQNILEVLYTDGMTDELYLQWEPYMTIDDAGHTSQREAEQDTGSES